MRSIRIVLLLIISLLSGQLVSGQAPVAKLRLQRARDTAGCAPHVLTFADSTTEVVTSRQFTTSNGLSSTSTPWTTVFSQPGTYIVRLRVTNASGSSMDSMTIRVYANPIPSFTVSDTTGCVPLNVTFDGSASQAGSGTITRYIWFYGDGTRDTVPKGGNPITSIITHTYRTPNNNTTPVLQVTNSFGCFQVFPQPTQSPKRIQVGAGVIPSFTDSIVRSCITPLPVYFRNTSAGDVANATFTWSFGDNTTVQDNTVSPGFVIHNYNTGGIYPVQLLAVSNNGCRDSVTNNIAVAGFETKLFGPDTLCARTVDTFSFTTNTVPVSYNWSIDPPQVNFNPGTLRKFGYQFLTPGNYTIKLTVDYGSCDTVIEKKVFVRGNPVVTFTASDSVGCVKPHITTFSTPAVGATYSWTFGTGASPATGSGASTGNVTYNNFGSYTVKLLVTSAEGCKDSLIKTNYIRIDTPKGTIAAPPRICSGPGGYTPVYTGTAPDQVKQFNFTYQQILPTAGPVQSVTVLRDQAIAPFPTNTSGTYRLTMQVVSEEGCVSSPIIRDIVVGDRLDAYIYATKDSLCPEDTLRFRAIIVTGTATAFRWNFGVGATPTTSTIQNTLPVRYSSGSGEKYITLVLTSNNCETILRDTIFVSPPAAGFTSRLLDCVGSRTNFKFTNSSTGTPDTSGNSYVWTFGYGLTPPLGNATDISPVFNFPNPGQFTIHLRATDTTRTNGCSDTTVSAIYVIPKGSTTFTGTATTICKGETITFTATPPFASAITSYSWLVVNNGATIYSNTGAFSSRTIRMTALGNWSARMITVDRNGCRDTFNLNGQVIGMRPGFSISPIGGCTTDAITFSDTTTVLTGGAVQSRIWRFGDGSENIGNNQTVQYTYPVEGRYTVQLLMTDASGCVDSLTKTAAVLIGNIKAGFLSIDSMSCPGKTVQFTDTSSGNIQNWKWYFSLGNNNSLGTTGTANPSYVYGVNDTTVRHTIALVVTAESGCKDSIAKVAYVTIKQPRALFNPLDTTSKCPPLIVDYRDSSYYAKTWTWDFDDLGTVSADTNASHTFLFPRVYRPYLVVTSPGGCTDTARSRVQVDGPYGQLTYGPPRTACDSLVVTNLKVQSRLSSAYLWLYGDGTSLLTTSDTLQRHTYYWDSASTGRYIPSVVLFDTSYFRDQTTSCRVALQGNYVGIDTFNQDRTDDTLLVVHATPYSFADRQLLCDTGTVSFRDSTIANTDIVHSWDFGDATAVSTDVNPTHFYAAPGVYTVKHSVTSLGSVQCQDTATYLTVRVVRSPEAVILLPSGDSICRPAPFQFAGSRVTPDTSNINLWTWDWRFGNGGTASVQNPPVQIFPNSGTFADTLIVRNASGCVDTAFRSVFVPSDNDLIVGFTRSLQVLCDTGTVQFTDTSIINVGGTRTYTWTFGGAGSSSVQNPTRFFGTPGVYDVKLVISTTKNCIDSFTAPVKVINRSDSLKLAFTATPRQVCDSGVVNFTDNSLIRIPGAYTYRWSFGDNTADDVRQNPDHKYRALGNYAVTLRILAAQPSCSDSITVADYIRVVGKPVPVIDIGPNDSLCFPALFVFGGRNTDTSTVVNWQWTLGNGQTFTGKNPPPQPFNTVGTFTNTLVATNATGCVQTVTRSSTVMPLPSLVISDDTTICRGTTANLVVSGASRYEWVPTQDLSNATGANTLAGPLLDRRYVVTGTSSFGCKSDTSVNILVFQPYTLTVAQNADSICGNGSTQLMAMGAPKYNWSPALGLNATDVANPIANPPATTLYTVSGNDSLNCFPQTQTVDVRKFAYPLVNIGPDVILNAGTTYTFNPTVSADVTRYRWTPPNGLSSSTIRNPSLIASANTTYILTVTNDGECQSRDTVKVLVTCDNGNVYMPNTFSPNNDGINDYFFPRGIGLQTIRSMRIFNRWGRMVFEKRNLSPNNQNDGWDGKIDGKAPQSDAYVYMVEIQCSTGQILKYTGTITLVN